MPLSPNPIGDAYMPLAHTLSLIEFFRKSTAWVCGEKHAVSRVFYFELKFAELFFHLFLPFKKSVVYSLMRVLLIDNNDSFTYNIVELLRSLHGAAYDVLSSKGLEMSVLEDYSHIIISPGPMTPSDFPELNDVIAFCEDRDKPLLGICLGHQAICEYFGGRLVRMDKIVHGHKESIGIDNHSIIYNELPDTIDVGLYHSWRIDHHDLPDELLITGMSQEDCLMSVQHRSKMIFGIQFHPESFLTTRGNRILENFTNIKA